MCELWSTVVTLKRQAGKENVKNTVQTKKGKNNKKVMNFSWSEAQHPICEPQ